MGNWAMLKPRQGSSARVLDNSPKLQVENCNSFLGDAVAKENFASVHNDYEDFGTIAAEQQGKSGKTPEQKATRTNKIAKFHLIPEPEVEYSTFLSRALKSQSAESAIGFGGRLQRLRSTGLRIWGSCSIPTAPTSFLLDSTAIAKSARQQKAALRTEGRRR
jgi:hypothetical protein